MAQIKNNNVTWGVNVGKPTISLPNFGLKSTTPATVQTTSVPLSPPAPIKSSALNTPGITGSNGTVNTATSNYNSPTRDQQISSIAAQAQGVQSLLNQKIASDKTTQTTAPAVVSPYSSRTGILSSLLGTSGNTAEQDRVRKEMEAVARQNQAIGDSAKATSDKYATEIARVGGLGAGAVAGDMSTGTNVVGAGNANLASTAASQRIQALGTAQDAALKGTAQQLTAQQQTTEGLNPSLNAALTQQQTGVTGYTNALNQSQPVQVPYGNQYIDPITGQSAGGAGLGGYSGYNAAQQSIELAGQYPDANVQYDPSQTPEQNLQRIQQAVQNSPTYQRGAFGAAGANSYIGAQQLGAAGDLTNKVAQLQTVGNAADANFNLILDIAKRGNINDLNQPVLNQLSQGLSRGLTSNQDVIAFRSGLQTVRSQYAAILGGGTPTDATQAMAAEKIPDTVSLSALQEVERTMKSLIGNTTASYNQQINAYSQQGSKGGSSFAEQW